ncbi:MAG: CBS domain-containing protein [Solirubrobacteraceae bacterium]
MGLPSNFSELAISDVMHYEIVDCPPQTPLREVASLMAEHNIHCVVVDGLARGPHDTERFVWGLVSDLDLMRAEGAGRLEDEAGKIASTEIVTVNPNEDIQRAAQVMGEHDCSHLIVTDTESGRPIGVVSSIDVARALVWGPRPSAELPAP